MEFFQTLYPSEKIRRQIRNLKIFQEILGEFQDLEVQEKTLKKYSEEMMKGQFPTNTLLAMGVLIQNLDNRRCLARKAFASKFEEFTQKKNQNAFLTLFKTH